MSNLPRFDVVILAYGAEPLLAESVASVLAQEDAEVTVVVVDNGADAQSIFAIDSLPRVRLVVPGRNLGFAAGANLGARHGDADHVAFVNSDVVLRPGALAALAAALEDETVGLATASLRLRDDPETMNSCGNPVHFLGLSWAGGLGEPAGDHLEPRDVASVSGACFAARRTTWEGLDGFYEPLFLYHEDTELSLRCWQTGLAVRFVPGAVAEHGYEFARHTQKWGLLERNRLVMMLTLWEARTLALMLPGLLGLEVTMMVVAVRQGWARQKLAGWWWLVTRTRMLRRRRAELSRKRVTTDARVLVRLTGRMDPGSGTGVKVPAVVNLASAAYWSAVRRALSLSTPRV